MKIRVYYEDTDCGGIVYHTNFIKFCERARSEEFFSRNQLPQTQEVGFVVRSLNAQFYSSARLGDLLEVQTEVVKIQKVSLVLLQQIYKEGVKIFEMQVKMGCINIKTGKPQMILPEFLEVLECKI